MNNTNPSRRYIALLSRIERTLLARAAKTSEQYLHQIGRGLRSPSRKMAFMLEQAAPGSIRAWDFDEEARKKAAKEAFK